MRKMSGRKTILVVEDEAMIGMMLEDFLDELDYVCAGVVASIGDAMARVEAGGFDAAILDCNLAGQKVWPVAEALAARGVPFIFATGGSADEMPATLDGHPALSKPFTIGAVEAALGGLFRGN